MNKYYLVKITLTNLDKENCKLEYRELYKHLKKNALVDWFFDPYDNEKLLPEGMYAALFYGQSQREVLEGAEEAIDLAFQSFYNTWKDKYTLVISGPSELYSRNLEMKED